MLVLHHLVRMTERVKILAWRDLGTNVFVLTGEWVTNVRTRPVSKRKILLSFSHGFVDIS